MGTGTWVWCQKLEIRDAAQTTCLDDSFSYLDIGYHASFVNVDASIPFVVIAHILVMGTGTWVCHK
jgi:hypothetical protein